ncbi:SdpI family protein [uncultured Solobacterium sp.]|uniref:SdpI family protein n=1 Tax=uncultured Solobacterium sp. TaxID=747375 RepID=UPI0028DB877D|nr:SdpI family protein [uncultured Solobacterium sp.]
MKNKKLFYLLMFLPLIASLIALQFLPDVIPAHYNIDNVVDRWGSKYEILILPVLTILFGFFSLAMGRIAQKQEPQGNNNEKNSLFIGTSVLLIFNLLCGFMIFSSLNKIEKLEFASFTFIKLVVIIIGIFLIVISNIMPKVKRNSILGFRTKQTMKNEDIWKKCQRFSGLTGVIAGFIIVVISFLLDNTTLIIALLIITFIKLGIDIAYSYKVDD